MSTYAVEGLEIKATGIGARYPDPTPHSLTHCLLIRHGYGLALYHNDGHAWLDVPTNEVLEWWVIRPCGGEYGTP